MIEYNTQLININYEDDADLTFRHQNFKVMIMKK